MSCKVERFKGWEDRVVGLVPHEAYVKLSKFSGVEFLGNSRFMAAFLPEQGVEKPGFWEAHWWAKPPAILAYRSAKKCLAEFFKTHYNTRIIGLTDAKNLEALKMAKLLGFRPLRFVRLESGLFLLSVKEEI